MILMCWSGNILIEFFKSRTMYRGRTDVRLSNYETINLNNMSNIKTKIKDLIQNLK